MQFERNLGRDASSSSGFSKTIRKSHTVIVLGDDMDVSPSSLKFISLGPHKHAEKNNKVSLCPAHSLVRNIGFDGFGTLCQSNSDLKR